jgi:transposase
MRELSVAEQRYRAVLEVIAEGRTVGEVAAQWGVTRQTVHGWLARYEAEGLEGLADRSHRPVSCPHQMSRVVEALVLELRRAHPYWGARRILVELARKEVVPSPSESGVYRALVRCGVIDPARRHRHRVDLDFSSTAHAFGYRCAARWVRHGYMEWCPSGAPSRSAD